MPELVHHFEDEYEGPRYTYGLALRPLSAFTVPGGWIIGSARPAAHFLFGVVDFARELTPAECDRFDLILVASPADDDPEDEG
jgi:hypothetical protein